MNEVESIDSAIDQVERLYRSVTGRDAPPISEEPYATIPPERAPEEHIQEQIDRLVEKLSELSENASVGREWRPPISFWESRNEVLINVDLPGVARDAVQVTVCRGLLEVTGSRPVQYGQNGEQFDLRYSEQPVGKFRRTIPLPIGSRIDQLRARMRGGLLEVHMPREGGASDVKTIPVG